VRNAILLVAAGLVAGCAGDITVRTPPYTLQAEKVLAHVTVTDRRTAGVAASKRDTFGVPMGNIRFAPPETQVVKDLLEGELTKLLTEQGVQTPREYVCDIVEFGVNTDTTPLYWDVIGRVRLTVKAGSGEWSLVGTHTERTYVWPGEEVIRKAVEASLGQIAAALKADAALVAARAPATALTNDAIVGMVKAGLGEEGVLDKIKRSPGQYDVSVQGLIRLKEAGVSDAVIKAMLAAAALQAIPDAQAPPVAAPATPDAIALYQQGRGAEAEAAFDKLRAERPDDIGLQVWKALALLEQARAKKDAGEAGASYRPLVDKAYAMLQPLGRTQAANPDWNFAMAQAYWLNDRPDSAARAARTALRLRANYAEPHLLLGDLAYDNDLEILRPVNKRPSEETASLGITARKEYETALALPDLPAARRAEALYKLGRVVLDVDKKPVTAREYWERAVAADPHCRYGVLAQTRLKVAPGK
jgi:hypothetical protein